jgi:hypothetical protein
MTNFEKLVLDMDIRFNNRFSCLDNLTVFQLTV